MYPRKKYFDKIDDAIKTVPIIILIGARQVGKTSIMKMYKYQKPSIYINGQDAEVTSVFQKLSVLESYLKINLNSDLDGLIFIDEFQYIADISVMLKILTDKYPNIKCICSGSSSLNILQQVKESLAGRVRIIEVFSLSFSEYLQFTDDKLFHLYESLNIDTEDSALTQKLSQANINYLLFGGLPRAALSTNPKQKLAVLDDIYKTYLLQDVRSFIKTEHSFGFNKVLKFLAAQIGNLVNVNEISREAGIPYRACENYISLLEQMYIIKLVSPFSGNTRNTISKMKKVYFCDVGIRNMIISSFSEIDFRQDKGAIFENYILLELLRNKMPGGDIQFYRTKDGSEVDFVVNRLFDRMAVECKFRIMNKPSHSRAMAIFSENENIDKKVIINKNLNTTDRNVKFVQGYFVGKLNSDLDD